MGKNAQLHLVLETELLTALKKESVERGLSVSELCRQKLRECSQLTRIEMKLERLTHKLIAGKR